jgi:hypothetical protein
MAHDLETDDEATGARPDPEQVNLATETTLSPATPDAAADDTGPCISYSRIAIVLAPIIVVAGLIRWLLT